jgi:hypothetical protein
MAAKLDNPQPEAPAEVVAPDFILLQKGPDGSWGLSSNVHNPERILRIIGAQMVLRHEG